MQRSANVSHCYHFLRTEQGEQDWIKILELLLQHFVLEYGISLNLKS